jgi:tetratricopeptide (TPR) repeat protein
MSFRRTLPAGSLTLALALAATARADVVNLIPGTAKTAAPRGEVVAESASEVKVKLGNNVQTVPTDQIASITYSNAPPSYALAETRENAGALAEAADQYKKAAGEASGKPFVQQAAQFNQARVTAEMALADPAKTADAVALLDAFVKAHPNGRHVVPALETLTRLQLNKGDFARAERTITELSKQPASAGRAAVLRAKLSAKKGDHAAAVKELDAQIKGAEEGSPRQREARLAKAESLAALQKYAEAEAEAKAVIKALPPEDIQGQSAAYNTLGDCFRAANKPKDALMAYLHTDILYSKDKEQHPRALANIAKLWRELKRDDRADEVLQKLKQEYPASPWLAANRSGP